MAAPVKAATVLMEESERALKEVRELWGDDTPPVRRLQKAIQGAKQARKNGRL